MGDVRLVAGWLMEYACVHRMTSVIHAFTKDGTHSAGVGDGEGIWEELLSQSTGPVPSRMMLLTIESVMQESDETRYETTITLIDHLFSPAAEHVPFKVYLKCTTGLKILTVFYHLRTKSKMVLTLLNQYFPANNGSFHPNTDMSCDGVTHCRTFCSIAGHFFTLKPQNTMKKMEEAQQRFRKFFLPLIADSRSRHKYMRESYEEDFGTRFVTILKKHVRDLIGHLEKLLPTPVLMKLLTNRDVLLRLSRTGSPALSTLADGLEGLSEPTDQTILKLLHSVLHPSISNSWSSLSKGQDSSLELLTSSAETCSQNTIKQSVDIVTITVPDSVLQSNDVVHGKIQLAKAHTAVKGHPAQEGRSGGTTDKSKNDVNLLTTAESPSKVKRWLKNMDQVSPGLDGGQISCKVKASVETAASAKEKTPYKKKSSIQMNITDENHITGKKKVGDKEKVLDEKNCGDEEKRVDKAKRVDGEVKRMTPKKSLDEKMIKGKGKELGEEEALVVIPLPEGSSEEEDLSPSTPPLHPKYAISPIRDQANSLEKVLGNKSCAGEENGVNVEKIVGGVKVVDELERMDKNTGVDVEMEKSKDELGEEESILAVRLPEGSSDEEVLSPSPPPLHSKHKILSIKDHASRPSPKKVQHSPTKQQTTPTKRLSSATVGSASPAKSLCSHTKASTSPAAQLKSMVETCLVNPLQISPIKRLASPAKWLATHAESLRKCNKEINNKDGSPKKKHTSPDKQHTGPAKVQTIPKNLPSTPTNSQPSPVNCHTSSTVVPTSLARSSKVMNNEVSIAKCHDSTDKKCTTNPTRQHASPTKAQPHPGNAQNYPKNSPTCTSKHLQLTATPLHHNPIITIQVSDSVRHSNEVVLENVQLAMVHTPVEGHPAQEDRYGGSTDEREDCVNASSTQTNSHDITEQSQDIITISESDSELKSNEVVHDNIQLAMAHTPVKGHPTQEDRYGGTTDEGEDSVNVPSAKTNSNDITEQSQDIITISVSDSELQFSEVMHDNMQLAMTPTAVEGHPGQEVQYDGSTDRSEDCVNTSTETDSHNVRIQSKDVIAIPVSDSFELKSKEVVHDSMQLAMVQPAVELAQDARYGVSSDESKDSVNLMTTAKSPSEAKRQPKNMDQMSPGIEEAQTSCKLKASVEAEASAKAKTPDEKSSSEKKIKATDENDITGKEKVDDKEKGLDDKNCEDEENGVNIEKGVDGEKVVDEMKKMANQRGLEDKDNELGGAESLLTIPLPEGSSGKEVLSPTPTLHPKHTISSIRDQASSKEKGLGEETFGDEKNGADVEKRVDGAKVVDEVKRMADKDKELGEEKSSLAAPLPEGSSDEEVLSPTLQPKDTIPSIRDQASSKEKGLGEEPFGDEEIGVDFEKTVAGAKVVDVLNRVAKKNGLNEEMIKDKDQVHDEERSLFAVPKPESNSDDEVLSPSPQPLQPKHTVSSIRDQASSKEKGLGEETCVDKECGVEVENMVDGVKVVDEVKRVAKKMGLEEEMIKDKDKELGEDESLVAVLLPEGSSDEEVLSPSPQPLHPKHTISSIRDQATSQKTVLDISPKKVQHSTTKLQTYPTKRRSNATIGSDNPVKSLRSHTKASTSPATRLRSMVQIGLDKPLQASSLRRNTRHASPARHASPSHAKRLRNLNKEQTNLGNRDGSPEKKRTSFAKQHTSLSLVGTNPRNVHPNSTKAQSSSSNWRRRPITMSTSPARGIKNMKKELATGKPHASTAKKHAGHSIKHASPTNAQNYSSKSHTHPAKDLQSTATLLHHSPITTIQVSDTVAQSSEVVHDNMQLVMAHTGLKGDPSQEILCGGSTDESKNSVNTYSAETSSHDVTKQSQNIITIPVSDSEMQSNEHPAQEDRYGGSTDENKAGVNQISTAESPSEDMDQMFSGKEEQQTSCKAKALLQEQASAVGNVHNEKKLPCEINTTEENYITGKEKEDNLWLDEKNAGDEENEVDNEESANEVKLVDELKIYDEKGVDEEITLDKDKEVGDMKSLLVLSLPEVSSDDEVLSPSPQPPHPKRTSSSIKDLASRPFKRQKTIPDTSSNSIQHSTRNQRTAPTKQLTSAVIESGNLATSLRSHTKGPSTRLRSTGQTSLVKRLQARPNRRPVTAVKRVTTNKNDHRVFNKELTNLANRDSSLEKRNSGTSLVKRHTSPAMAHSSSAKQHARPIKGHSSKAWGLRCLNKELSTIGERHGSLNKKHAFNDKRLAYPARSRTSPRNVHSWPTKAQARPAKWPNNPKQVHIRPAKGLSNQNKELCNIGKRHCSSDQMHASHAKEHASPAEAKTTHRNVHLSPTKTHSSPVKQYTSPTNVQNSPTVTKILRSTDKLQRHTPIRQSRNTVRRSSSTVLELSSSDKPHDGSAKRQVSPVRMQSSAVTSRPNIFSMFQNASSFGVEDSPAKRLGCPDKGPTSPAISGTDMQIRMSPRMRLSDVNIKVLNTPISKKDQVSPGGILSPPTTMVTPRRRSCRSQPSVKGSTDDESLLSPNCSFRSCEEEVPSLTRMPMTCPPRTCLVKTPSRRTRRSTTSPRSSSGALPKK